MRSQRILLIINPVSGKMKSKTGLFEILDELYRDELGTPDPMRRVTVCPTMYRGHASALAASAFKEGFDTVIACGGDGTLNEVINGLMTQPPHERPVLGYVPAGSTNDFAQSIGLPSSLREAAIVASGDNECPLDVGQFIPADPGTTVPPRHFSYIASFGAFAETSFSTPQASKNVFGHAAYFIACIPDIGNIQPRHVRIELDGGRIVEGDYLFGAMTNTTSAAGVVKLPAGEVSVSDGLLEVFLISMPRNPAEFNKLAQSLLSGDFTSQMISLYHTSRARFTMPEPLCWSLDGEEGHGGTTVDVICRPSAVSFRRARS